MVRTVHEPPLQKENRKANAATRVAPQPLLGGTRKRTNGEKSKSSREGKHHCHPGPCWGEVGDEGKKVIKLKKERFILW